MHWLQFFLFTRINIYAVTDLTRQVLGNNCVKIKLDNCTKIKLKGTEFNSLHLPASPLPLPDKICPRPSQD